MKIRDGVHTLLCRVFQPLLWDSHPSLNGLQATIQVPSKAAVWVEVGGLQHPLLVRAIPCSHCVFCAAIEPCLGDRSISCGADTLSSYCSIPGFRQLCCETCSRWALGPSTDLHSSLASSSAFSTPWSPQWRSTTPQGMLERIKGTVGSKAPPWSSSTLLPRPQDTSDPAIQQHPWASPSPPWGQPWTPTEASLPVSQAQDPGTSFPATAQVT